MFNKVNDTVEAFTVSIRDYVGGVLGVSATVNFYELLSAIGETIRKRWMKSI